MKRINQKISGGLLFRIFTFLIPILLFMFSMACLVSCAQSEKRTSDSSQDDVQFCQVVLEDNEAFVAKESVLRVPRGGTAVFSLRVNEGYTLIGTDFSDSANAMLQMDGTSATLTIHNVIYPAVVSIMADKTPITIQYAANGGTRLDGLDASMPISIDVTDSKLRHNTSVGIDLFSRDGFTLIGWNTAPDGNGTAVGLGSRVAWEEGLTLYAQWSKWTDDSFFSFEIRGDGAIITGFRSTEFHTGANTSVTGANASVTGGSPDSRIADATGDLPDLRVANVEAGSDILTIPANLGGHPVLSIDEYAFQNCPAKTVILPPGLKSVRAYAFCGSALETLYLSDDIVNVSDYAFKDCPDFSTLHVNAVEAPVYGTNYYATFQDKFDRLVSLRDEKKIVLFSGSSTRFGYDSEMIDDAFPDYEVVNMGVFAYTNAYPQLLLILDNMQKGDILLHSPEFDAAQRQFCVRTELDAPFFCMMEANYDTLALLDLRETTLVFTAFNSYLKTKESLPPQNYSLSPADYDEDGNPLAVNGHEDGTHSSTANDYENGANPNAANDCEDGTNSNACKSYNEYGDYVLYRPNADTDEPVYGLGVEYTVSAFPANFIESLNQAYSRFLQNGITVYFAYAPRNRLALSEESTETEREKLHAYFQETLLVPVISELEDSLYPGRYLYGTDNHLSTEGVAIRTESIIEDLQKQMERDKLEGTDTNRKQ